MFDDELAQFAMDLTEAMRRYAGIGLAANQVGSNRRMLAVARELVEGAPQDLVLINPVISLREGEAQREEGCLSLPGIRYQIPGRADRVVVSYQDISGTHCKMEASGLGAVCIQHEIDHLNGLTMMDHLSPLKASRAKAKLAKRPRRRQ